MRRFKNILVCVNLEEQDHPALERAFQLAQHNDAAVKVVAAQEELPPWAPTLLPSRVQSWEAIVEHAVKERLDSLIAPLREGGIAVSSRLLVGIPFVEVIREAATDAHDLLLKDMELESTPEKPAIGSMDMHLFRKCPCPVWLIKPGAGRRFERVLAAVDPVPGDDEVRNSLNTKVLELATSLALQEECQLFVVRAYESIGEAFLATELDSREYSEYMERIQMMRLKNDKEFIGRFETQGGELDVRYVHGDPGVVIPQVARDEDIDLIVMGTVTRTGIPGLLMGKTAETVLRLVTCSVLGVKPRGFVSPI